MRAWWITCPSLPVMARDDLRVWHLMTTPVDSSPITRWPTIKPVPRKRGGG